MEIRFECNICGKSFASGDNLRNHNYSMHEVKRDLQCGECHKLFSHQSIFKTHFKNVHEAIKTMHKCEVCDTSLTSKQSLRDHMNSLHLEKKGFQCGECGKSFTHQKLKRHIESVHGSNTVSCDLCSKTLKIRSLEQHKKILHQNAQLPRGETVDCHICGKSITKPSLKVHIESQHQNIRYNVKNVIIPMQQSKPSDYM